MDDMGGSGIGEDESEESPLALNFTMIPRFVDVTFTINCLLFNWLLLEELLFADIEKKGNYLN